MRRDVGAEGVEFGLELHVEHVADHRHARRPLRHSAEIGMAKLGHPAAAAAESSEHDLHRRRRHRMLLGHPVNQIVVAYRHFVIPEFKKIDGDRALSGGRARRRPGPRRSGQSKTFIGGDGTIGEDQPAAQTLPDHGLDGVAEKPACGGAVAQFEHFRYMTFDGRQLFRRYARNISDLAGATAPINPGHEVFGLAAAWQYLCGGRVTVRPNPIAYARPLRWKTLKSTPVRHLMTKNNQRLTLLATSIRYVLVILVPSST
jgi:hypothetical protein